MSGPLFAIGSTACSAVYCLALDPSAAWMWGAVVLLALAWRAR